MAIFFYTDEKMTAFIAGGQLIEGKTMKNLTEERMRKLTAIKFSELPLERAIKQVRGDGKRVLATFEDPNCGYCKRLAKDLQKLDNVTIYTFLYPILSEDSIRKSKQIWCSADRAKAWNDWMVEGRAPAGQGRLRHFGGRQEPGVRAPSQHQRYADHVLWRRRTRPGCHAAGEDRAEAQSVEVSRLVAVLPGLPAVSSGQIGRSFRLLAQRSALTSGRMPWRAGRRPVAVGNCTIAAKNHHLPRRP